MQCRNCGSYIAPNDSYYLAGKGKRELVLCSYICISEAFEKPLLNKKDIQRTLEKHKVTF